jgi:hypothetical protein
MRRLTLALLLGSTALSLSGCDMLGIESATVVAARREAEGKAVGGGCRHAARSVEQCYEMNKRADKAAVFAGWREMNDYMRENKLDAMPNAAEVVTEVAAAGEHAESPAPEAPAKPGAKAGKGEKAEKTEKGDKPAGSAAAKH